MRDTTRKRKETTLGARAGRPVPLRVFRSCPSVTSLARASAVLLGLALASCGTPPATQTASSGNKARGQSDGEAGSMVWCTNRPKNGATVAASGVYIVRAGVENLDDAKKDVASLLVSRDDTSIRGTDKSVTISYAGLVDGTRGSGTARRFSGALGPVEGDSSSTSNTIELVFDPGLQSGAIVVSYRNESAVTLPCSKVPSAWKGPDSARGAGPGLLPSGAAASSPDTSISNAGVDPGSNRTGTMTVDAGPNPLLPNKDPQGSASTTTTTTGTPGNGSTTISSGTTSSTISLTK